MVSGFESLPPSQPSLALRASFGWVGALRRRIHRERSKREGCRAEAALRKGSEGGPQFPRTRSPSKISVSAYFGIDLSLQLDMS
jgi:hypothetical protein